MKSAVHAGLALLVTMLGVCSCTGILGSFDYTGTGGGTGGVGGSSSGTTSSSTCPGGAMACSIASDCAAQTSACLTDTCDTGCCGTAKAAARAACSDSMGRVCDGDGHCVACVQAADCPSPTTVCLVNACSGNACSTTNAAKSTICNDSNGKLCDGNGKCAACLATSDCSVPTTVCVIASCSNEACATSSAPVGTHCTDNSGAFCDGNGKCVQCNTTADCTAPLGCVMNKCVPASCSDGVQDGTETDVDCGGNVCGSCAAGKKCGVNSDCTSLYCKAGICATASCTDGVLDGSETDVDCGGSCTTKCLDGKHCGVAGDCANNNCFGGVCISCTDGIKDGSETDVDCGGSCATKCADSKHCIVGTDCTNGTCAGGVCVSCMDGIQDGNETDVDCGGSCTTKCAIGKHCGGNPDCTSTSCYGGVCVSCTDGIKDGTETDIDCGGSCTTKCADFKHCGVNADCTNGDCAGGVCISCMDGVKDGAETDVDCGGSCTTKCADRKHCSVNADCLNGDCYGGLCVSCTDGVKDGTETDVDCGGAGCPACAYGQGCLVGTDCKSTYCVGSPLACDGITLASIAPAYLSGGIAVDSTNVYFTEGAGTNSVMAVSINGGAVTNFSPAEDTPWGIVTVGSNVLWTTYGTVQKQAASGPPLTTLVSTGLNFAEGIASDGFSAYVTSFGNSTGMGAGTVIAVPIGGGTPTTLASAQNGPYGIAVDMSGWVYFTNFTDGTVMKVTTGGASLTTLATGLTHPRGIKTDGQFIYYCEPNKNLWRLPVTGGTPTSLAVDCFDLTLDATYVYFTTQIYGLVRKVAKTGGAVTSLASGNSPSPITSDANYLYWSNYSDGTVRKVHKY